MTEDQNTSNCIFCKIIRGEIPAEKIHEDEDSLSFLDINPVNDGHLLIIPKEHHVNMSMTPNRLIESLFVRAKNLMPVLQQGTNADFVVLTVVGTDVPHFHIHLIPRFHKDGLAGFWPVKKYGSSDQMKEVANKIRSNLT